MPRKTPEDFELRDRLAGWLRYEMDRRGGLSQNAVAGKLGLGSGRLSKAMKEQVPSLGFVLLVARFVRNATLTQLILEDPPEEFLHPAEGERPPPTPRAASSVAAHPRKRKAGGGDA